MKTLIIAILIVLTATIIVTPTKQACNCKNLLNQEDCLALSGCIWFATQTNINNYIYSCTNSSGTSQSIVTPTYCGSVVNATACTGKLGCAYINNTCQIFTGCSAYVYTSNSECQAISTQCTTDGQRCVPPDACSTYKTSWLCTNNIATSGAKQCKWTVGTGNTGTCSDMTCSDAPLIYNTLSLCQGWISNCLSDGQGCLTSLRSCNTYTTCKGIIGSEGPCTESSVPGSCRALACTDAPSDKATNTACNTFLKGCVTTGRGCVSVLDQCNSYSQKLGCQGLIGSDGPCINDAATGSCKSLQCTDASPSTIFDNACNNFLAGCQTTGQGCTSARGACSSYQGTIITCQKFIGSEGNCKGIGTTISACAAKLCTEAPTTLKTNAACNSFQTGCLTTGAGCVSTLGSCSTYQGTAATCLKYIGIDGNCTAPSSQTTAAACVAKVCADGPFTSNSACKEYSYQCVTNGTNCILPQICEFIEMPISCQGLYTCNLGQQCLNRSQCYNFTTQSQCLMNKQQYFYAGNTYLRSCVWRNNCQNQLCTDLPTILTTDAQCGASLAGCITTGAGCMDISAPCSSYQGIYLTCLNYKGINGTKACTQLQSQTTAANCIDKTCENATIANWNKVSYSQTSECQAYLSKCYWNGSTGCTSGGCSSYFGLQSTCSDIRTAGQPCWSLSTTGANVACINKTCAHADNILNTDAQCAAFLAGCITNGAGCYNPSTTLCSQLKGSLAQCQSFKQNQCTKLANFCTQKQCSDTIQSPNLVNCNSYLNTCTFLNGNCVQKGACSSYTVTTANGAIQCSTVTNVAGAACIYLAGTKCDQRTCADNIQSPSITTCAAYLSTCTFIRTSCVVKDICSNYTPTMGQEQTQCASVRDINGDTCKYPGSGTKCANKSCSDSITSPSLTSCQAYSSQCTFIGIGCVSLGDCSSYAPSEVTLCLSVTNKNGDKCTYSSDVTKCADRSCSDAIINPSVDSCSQYLSSCQYNGTKCVSSELQCDKISVTGTTDNEKATFCNRLMGGISKSKCSYISGDNCSDATACNLYNFTSQEQCSQRRNPQGSFCAFYVQLDPNRCSEISCEQFTESQCNDEKLLGCIINSSSSCTQKVCNQADFSLKTNYQCRAYREGCVTNGAGCVESSDLCSSYQGTQATCQTFTGGTDGLCDNVADATATTVCIPRACASNTFAKTDSTCAAWKTTCVWTGTTGCKDPSPCAEFIGTIDSCPNFKATDGPCSGIQLKAACVSNSTICNQAPASFTTNAECQTWHANCITNGFGCISSVGAACNMMVSSNACTSQNILGCDRVSECLTRPQTCEGFTTAFQCNNIQISTKFTCAWSTILNACVNLTCSLLPTTLKTDFACSSVLSTCTTNGAGCVTKAACSTYNKQACGPASTTDIQQRCIWADSSCRPITCQDITGSLSDYGCSNYLKGCRGTGKGCTDSLTCPQIVYESMCLTDQWNNPCLWYNGKCIKYTECKDVMETTHFNCQLVSPLCTTNGTTCIAITSCSQYLQSSCILGTDGICGWLPATNTNQAYCSIFTNCSYAMGTTLSECKLWGSNCISNGTYCITKSTCSSYLTQASCLSEGTDGVCFYVPTASSTQTGYCRLQQCTDATNISTHNGCDRFRASTSCTTSGTGCIPLSNCSSYKVQAGCVQGIDGECFWDTITITSGVCRLKQCTDSQLKTNEDCSRAIKGVNCVSNGTNCIPQSICSSYQTQMACLGGGSDGQCVYLTNQRQCTQFNSCESARSERATCNLRSDACYFDSQSCITHTCATKALGSTCQPIPSFDNQTYTLCVLSSKCTEDSPLLLSQSECFKNSLGTRTWNPQIKVCQSCQNIINDQGETKIAQRFIFSLFIQFILII